MADGRIFVGIGCQRWEAASQQEEQANCPSAGGKLPCLHLLSRSNAQVQGAGKLATSMTWTATLRVEKGGNKKAKQKLEKIEQKAQDAEARARPSAAGDRQAPCRNCKHQVEGSGACAQVILHIRRSINFKKSCPYAANFDLRRCWPTLQGLGRYQPSNLLPAQVGAAQARRKGTRISLPFDLWPSAVSLRFRCLSPWQSSTRKRTGTPMQWPLTRDHSS